MYRNLPKHVTSPGSVETGRKSRGYSLYDLMVTAAVASVLGFVAVGMFGLIQDTRLATSVNLLMTHLNLARSEAIKRQTMVVICPSHSGATCSKSKSWQNGWIAFADANNNHKVDPAETVILMQQKLDGDLTLRYGSLHQYVRYSSRSMTWTGTFTFCDRRGSDKARAVIVYWTGRPRVSTKTSAGKPLNCKPPSA